MNPIWTCFQNFVNVLKKITDGDQRDDIMMDIERVTKNKNEDFEKLENLDVNGCV